MSKIHVDVKSNDIANFPYFDVKIRNMTLSDINVQEKTDSTKNAGPSKVEIKDLLKFLENFALSIVNLKLERVQYTNYTQFFDIFKALEKLRSLELEKCNWVHPWNVIRPMLSNLRSISLKECSSGCLCAVKSFKHLERVKSTRTRMTDDYIYELNNLLAFLPRLQHLTLEGAENTKYLKNPSFNFELRTLETYLSSRTWSQALKHPWRSFFEAQKSCLRELTFTQMPNHHDNGELLRFIFEEMKLDKFVYGNTTLIDNGKKVDALVDVLFYDFQLQTGLELLRQFRGEIFNQIASFSLFLMIFSYKKAASSAYNQLHP